MMGRIRMHEKTIGAKSDCQSRKRESATEKLTAWESVRPKKVKFLKTSRIPSILKNTPNTHPMMIWG
ncbi:hypothetical protein LPTSP4_01820 [Leptospira ryugenii]|uniref:Uncharacterized protein n=1 Tax=Leptospira ryugenii TaxID=1917863 RepID=A0A2P2DVL3_9LEPT|nr:hypothetical protein LPTSP4_01820 [Leptospira ryugenii]